MFVLFLSRLLAIFSTISHIFPHFLTFLYIYSKYLNARPAMTRSFAIRLFAILFSSGFSGISELFSSVSLFKSWCSSRGMQISRIRSILLPSYVFNGEMMLFHVIWRYFVLFLDLFQRFWTFYSPMVPFFLFTFLSLFVVFTVIFALFRSFFLLSHAVLVWCAPRALHSRWPSHLFRTSRDRRTLRDVPPDRLEIVAQLFRIQQFILYYIWWILDRWHVLPTGLLHSSFAYHY